MANPNDTSHRIARAVSQAIQAADLSVNAVATRSGIPQSTLDRKLKGVGTLDVAELGLIADALGLTIAALISPAEDAA